ncbi:hypothetical protein C5167_008700 [Papaver somniferum]|uniref:Uncharacterized protein n=1 Tax=Papaver somniferum TaxID=3469 RepID=A0A4Y7JYE6_PAPSO|nr:hypothetical protein C5167_008700 [Papaver somniferum]
MDYMKLEDVDGCVDNVVAYSVGCFFDKWSAVMRLAGNGKRASTNFAVYEETCVDKDAIAEVFGCDRGGFIRGMVGGVLKTELLTFAFPVAE